jgi:peptide/nickel transport system substrate-binding protein
VDAIRFRVGEVENDLVDELRGGRIDRREVVRRGTVLGLSLSSLGVLASCAQPNLQQVSAPPVKPPRPGGTIRSRIVAPAAALDPVQVSDEGGLAVLGQTGEYLAWSDKNLTLRPIVAQSWKHDSTGKVWTFNIRRGVRSATARRSRLRTLKSRSTGWPIRPSDPTPCPRSPACSAKAT